MLTVTVYTTGPRCVRCKMTKSAMTKGGIEWREVDVTEEPEARDYITEELGYSEAPVCVVEDGTGQDHWSGFRPEQIQRIATRSH